MKTTTMITTTTTPKNEEEKVIVIIGGGMAGLTCAKELLEKIMNNDNNNNDNIRVIIVEAQDVPGGRIKVDNNTLGFPIDIGAEFIHGTGTILTKYIKELYTTTDNDEDMYEEFFITSHADGGPQDYPTKDYGKYGMYYMDGKLHMYNDPAIQQLTDTLEDIHETSRRTSFGEALDDSSTNLSNSQLDLARSSFGNTAGTNNMHDISLSILQSFEKYWDENEDEGDYHLSNGRSMVEIVHRLVQLLQTKYTKNQFELLCNWNVTSLRNDEDGIKDRTIVQSESGRQTIIADAVVITVPPPILKKQIDMIEIMTVEKLDALSYIGFENLVKIICVFNERLWPEKVQSIICADNLPIPEIWFREFHNNNNDTTTNYVMIGYLGSQAADKFIEQIRYDQQHDDNSSIDEKKHGDDNESIDNANTTTCNLLLNKEKAALIAIEQLSIILSISKDIIQNSYIDCIIYDWKSNINIQGGYMYPKKDMKMYHLQTLAKPIGRHFFAGEATNTNACCTVQAAMETGLRAANQVYTYITIKNEQEHSSNIDNNKDRFSNNNIINSSSCKENIINQEQ